MGNTTGIVLAGAADSNPSEGEFSHSFAGDTNATWHDTRQGN